MPIPPPPLPTFWRPWLPASAESGAGGRQGRVRIAPVGARITKVGPDPAAFYPSTSAVGLTVAHCQNTRHAGTSRTANAPPNRQFINNGRTRGSTAKHRYSSFDWQKQLTAILLQQQIQTRRIAAAAIKDTGAVLTSHGRFLCNIGFTKRHILEIAKTPDGASTLHAIVNLWPILSSHPTSLSVDQIYAIAVGPSSKLALYAVCRYATLILSEGLRNQDDIYCIAKSSQAVMILTELAGQLVGKSLTPKR